MRPSMHTLVVGTFVPMLGSLRDWLTRASARKSSSDALFETTLAPGMYGLGLQVRVACDHALASAARLAEEPSPQIAPAAGTDVEGLRTLLDETIATLLALPERAFRGAEERTIEMALDEGLVMKMTGERFARDWALPLFYFHVVLAYGMLRHAGTELGTREYLQHIGDAITPAKRASRAR